jgi:hypothetical protein
MRNINKLGDILDMKYYLACECYCPGEIYDLSRFFFRVYGVDSECKLLMTLDVTNNLTNGKMAIIAVVTNEESPQILMIAHKDNKIKDIARVDATENNIQLLKDIKKYNKTSLKFNEFKEGETVKSLYDILELSNGLVCRD